MPESNLTCPLCLYEAPPYMFENVDSGVLKCKRCRSRFKDINALRDDISYADCNDSRVLTYFPFAVDGCNTMVHVREDYLALAIDNGSIQWLEKGDHHITEMNAGFQLLYVCLTPWILWGANAEKFGAYGRAKLAITKDYVKAYYGPEGQLKNKNLEYHLQKILNQYVTNFVEEHINCRNTSSLEQPDSYNGLLGVIEEGISLVKIEPMGCRNENGYVRTFSLASNSTEMDEAPSSIPVREQPVDDEPPPKKNYTIKSGVEEVFFNGSKTSRHKAGEQIDTAMLRDIQRLFRFRTKEFEFANGWGLYNQPGVGGGYFSAHGTISFYIDSTEQLSLLLFKTRSWQEFEENFFTNVLKKEVSDALGTLIMKRARQQNFDPNRVNSLLSTMSLELTDMLNGELDGAAKPVIRRYGLRVNRVDILNLDFYDHRR